MVNILFVNTNGVLWHEVVDKLVNTNNFEITIISEFIPDSQKKDPRILHINSCSLLTGKYALDNINPKTKLSLFYSYLSEKSSFLNDNIDEFYSYIEPLMRHRTGFQNWSEQEIVFYIELWLSQADFILNSKTFDILLFPSAPHAFFDNILLLLASKFSTKCLTIEASAIFPISYLIEGYTDSYDNLINLPTFKQLNESEKLADSYIFSYSRSLYEQSDKKRFTPSYVPKIGELHSLLINYIGTIKSVFYNIYVSKRSSTGVLHKSPNSFYWSKKSFSWYFIFYTNILFKTLISYFRSIIHMLPLEYVTRKPFIAYFPPFQIENTSMPLHGWDFSAIRVLDKIRATIGQDILIVCKNHPVQFSYLSSSPSSRDKLFYARAKEIGCLFAKSSTTSYSLFSHKNCIAVVCNGSTVALEAVAHGKPVFETVSTPYTPWKFVHPLSCFSMDYIHNLNLKDLQGKLSDYLSNISKQNLIFWPHECHPSVNISTKNTFSSNLVAYLQFLYTSVASNKF